MRLTESLNEFIVTALVWQCIVYEFMQLAQVKWNSKLDITIARGGVNTFLKRKKKQYNERRVWLMIDTTVWQIQRWMCGPLKKHSVNPACAVEYSWIKVFGVRLYASIIEDCIPWGRNFSWLLANRKCRRDLSRPISGQMTCRELSLRSRDCSLARLPIAEE